MSARQRPCAKARGGIVHELVGHETEYRFGRAVCGAVFSDELDGVIDSIEPVEYVDEPVNCIACIGGRR